ncbi:MAG TPA: hypothetical protein VM032_15615 [Vicinamibacterales bacterium]|nr:hypothetical protein [Vicinamibacterales bacterium]
MNPRTGSILALALVVGSATTSVAQQPRVEADQQYLVLEVAKLDTFEKEINEAAGQGFRLMMSTTSENGARIQALMERAAAAPNVFQYRMVATFSEKTGDKEMNVMGADGFRVVPHTAMVKKGMTIFNTNSVVIMEKPPSSGGQFEYMTISAVKTATFHRELKTAVDDGWKVVDTTYGRVLLERQRHR